MVEQYALGYPKAPLVPRGRKREVDLPWQNIGQPVEGKRGLV